MSVSQDSYPNSLTPESTKIIQYDIYSLSTSVLNGASLVAQMVKNPPKMQEIRVQFLGQEDPLEKEMATHSRILAWEIPWTEEAWWATVHEGTRVRHDLATKPPPPPPHS